MREIKSGLVDAKERSIVVLQNIPYHHSLVKANRFLLLLASFLMVFVFILGFLLLPEDDMLNTLKVEQKVNLPTYTSQNPVLSAEINALKAQLVGLVSGSIESKLRILEENIRVGSVTASLGTIQDLRNDVSVLRGYSAPQTKSVNSPANEELLKEVSHLRKLIYLILTSCGLMIAAIGGFWVKRHYQLDHKSAVYKVGPGGDQ
ncbi:MAG: hypothetical protein KAT04_09755 [Methylococcales bacterium]|nr:hypothetical protein [Methylococcales bacterium]